MLLFVCIQCKLTLQVESKPIEILKIKKEKEKKRGSNQVGELEGKKKEEKGKSLNQKYCLMKRKFVSQRGQMEPIFNPDDCILKMVTGVVLATTSPIPKSISISSLRKNNAI